MFSLAKMCFELSIHEDLVTVADLQMFTVCHPKMDLNMNERRDTILKTFFTRRW